MSRAEDESERTRRAAEASIHSATEFAEAASRKAAESVEIALRAFSEAFNALGAVKKAVDTTSGIGQDAGLLPSPSPAPSNLPVVTAAGKEADAASTELRQKMATRLGELTRMYSSKKRKGTED